jgi:hypothetical protein
MVGQLRESAGGSATRRLDCCADAAWVTASEPVASDGRAAPLKSGVLRLGPWSHGRRQS